MKEKWKHRLDQNCIYLVYTAVVILATMFVLFIFNYFRIIDFDFPTPFEPVTYQRKIMEEERVQKIDRIGIELEDNSGDESFILRFDEDIDNISLCE